MITGTIVIKLRITDGGPVMRKRYLVSLILILTLTLTLTLILTTFFGCTAKEDYDRQPAVDFTLPDLNGRMVSLSDYEGQVVLINFWATWCVPCREEIPDFVELQSKYAADGFIILGISIDTIDVAEVKEFADEYKINYPVLYAGKQAKQLTRDYGNFRGIPASFLVNHEGIRIKRVIGRMEKPFWDKEIQSALKEKAEKILK
jgi:thiol-disulfide isomerase/thioredoxin